MTLKSAARSIPTEFDVIITGAGVSMDAPSELPSSDDLIELVWDAVVTLGPPSLPVGIRERVLDLIQEKGFEVRMEQFLDVLSGPEAIPVNALVEVYESVSSQVFNSNHVRLAMLDAKHFTVNMDTLIEAAGERNVDHLHGRWNDKASIKTTVSHYVDGLRPRKRHKLGNAIRNANVLVIGYSGRDIDVMPIFDEYPPKFITWVAPNANELEMEAEALRVKRRDLKLHFMPIPKYADEFLSPLVPTPISLEQRPESPSLVNMVQVLRERSTESQRTLGIASLLNTLGLNDATNALLRDARFQGRAEVQRRLLNARALARADRHGQALSVLLPRGNSFLEIVRSIGCIADISYSARRIGDRGLSRRSGLVSKLPWGNVRRRARLGRVRRAQFVAVDGSINQSIRMFDRATRRSNAVRIFGAANYVDALTWHADALKTRGDIFAARRIVERANLLAPYADQSQRAYALWKRCEIDGIAGASASSDHAGASAAHTHKLQEAIRFAERSGNHDALAWLNGTLAEHFAREDPMAARRAIHDAEGARQFAVAGHGPAYLALQCGIVDLAMGDPTRALSQVENAIALSEAWLNPILKMQARQFSIHIDWLDGNTSSLLRKLDELSDDFRQSSYLLSAARADAAAAMIRGAALPGGLLELARKKGWDQRDFGVGTVVWPSKEYFYFLV